MTAHVGQGAWNTTCNLRRRRYAAASSRTAGHARAWVLPPRRGTVRRGWLGRPGGWHHRMPHGEHPRDAGQHRDGGRVRVLGRGEGPVALEEAADGTTVGNTHPMAPGALCLVMPPLQQEHPMLGCVGPGLHGACTGPADGEGTLVPEGHQQRGYLGELRALPALEAGAERGRPAIPPAEGLVECGDRHCRALGDALHRRQPPPGVRARVRPVEEASHEDVLQAEEAGDRPLEGVESEGDSREGPFRALARGGQCAAHMGEPKAEGRCRVAPRQPAAQLMLPGMEAANRNRLQPVPAHPVRGRRREGAVRGHRGRGTRPTTPVIGGKNQAHMKKSGSQRDERRRPRGMRGGAQSRATGLGREDGSQPRGPSRGHSPTSGATH